jgi:hypothetical protein
MQQAIHHDQRRDELRQVDRQMGGAEQHAQIPAPAHGPRARRRREQVAAERDLLDDRRRDGDDGELQ